MPYLIPPRTPLAPKQVERAFDYVIALQLGGGGNVADRADADPELAFLLLRLAEDIVFPATAVSDDDDPCSATAPQDLCQNPKLFNKALRRHLGTLG